MASTFRLDGGNAITVAAGPQDRSDGVLGSRDLRLEVFGRSLNGGTMVFLDMSARAWLRAKLDEWDK
jgi:hypothetical protein